jgi:hypothetical protein
MQSGGQQDSEAGARWTDAFLDQMRRTADPLGDETVAKIFQAGDVNAVNSLWDHLKNDATPPAGLGDYLEKSAILPAWADPKLIEQGEQLFTDRGVFCLISLLCASLPECYVLQNEAAVLGTTQKLEQHAYRRIFETTQLIVAVMSPGGLTGNKKGVVAAQKVRLMHAAIRHLIINTPRKPGASAPPKSFIEAVQQMPPWDLDKYGCPINQEDMAYTLLTFSYVILEAFQKLKIPLGPGEIEAYLHSWNVLGHVLGVRDDLLCHNFADAQALFSKIKNRQIGASKDGATLADALVKCTRQVISHETGGIVSGPIVRHLPQILMRLLLDKETRVTLGIKRLTVCEWLMLVLIRFMMILIEPLYQKLVISFGTRFGLLIIDHLTEIPRGWNRQLFDIPQNLKAAWEKKAGRH